MFSRIYLLVLVTGTVSAGQWSDDNWKPEKNGNKEGCYINEVHRVIAFNETIQIPGYCYVMRCTPQKIVYDACGVDLTDDIDCDIKYIRFTNTYPACCASIHCLQEQINRPLSRNRVFTSWNTQGTRTRRKVRVRFGSGPLTYYYKNNPRQ